MNVHEVAAAALTLLSIVLFIASIRFWVGLFRADLVKKPAIPLRFSWHPPRVPRFALFLTLALLGLYFTALMMTSRLKQASNELTSELLISNLIEQVLVFLVLFAAVLFGSRSRTRLVRLGLRTDHPEQQIKDGVVGLVAVVLPMAFVLILTSPIRSSETEHTFLQLLRDRGFSPEFFMVAVSAIILAPLKEELMFRVILQSWFQEHCRPGIAILLSSVLFSAIHGFPDALALMPLAIGLGFVYQRRSSYLAVVAMHSLFNAYNVLGALVGGRSS